MNAEDKILLLEKTRKGLVDPWSLLVVLEVPSTGRPPEWAANIVRRLRSEKFRA